MLTNSMWPKNETLSDYICRMRFGGCVSGRIIARARALEGERDRLQAEVARLRAEVDALRALGESV